VGNLAGDVLQVVCPRSADDDGVIQWEGTGKKLVGNVPRVSARLRTQPAIVHYKPQAKSARCTQPQANRMKVLYCRI
jgi:hypothetical protein